MRLGGGGGGGFFFAATEEAKLAAVLNDAVEATVDAVEGGRSK
jgi:hypothetical protein